MRSKKFQDLETEEIREQVEANKGKTKTGGTILFEWFRDFILAIIVAMIVMHFIKPTIVKQRSMEPNFYTNDYILVSKESYGFFRHTPEMGEVVIFETDLEAEEGEGRLLIKRVIGVPGDVISIKDGKVYVNGQIIDDSYTKDQYTNGNISELVIPENKLFCLGDNRAVSVDSRSEDVGLVDFDDLIGKAVFRLYPFSEFGRIKNPYD